MRFFIFAFLMLCLSSAARADEATRLSGIVAFTPKSEAFTPWLDSLSGNTYMQAWVRFPAVTGDDVIFGVDQEFTDGLRKPHFFAGGDWMGFVGLQRTGNVWVGGGTEDTMAGKPSKERNWKILTLPRPLEPDTWYKIRSVVDFESRRYVSFEISGGGINHKFDLTDTFLDYPNYMPFSGRSLTNYVLVMRGDSLMKDTGAHGEAIAYFDEVEAGLAGERGDIPFYKDGFETQADAVPQQALKVEGETIMLSSYKPGKWYLEQEKARCRSLESAIARSGGRVAMCDGTLQTVDYDEWLATSHVLIKD